MTAGWPGSVLRPRSHRLERVHGVPGSKLLAYRVRSTDPGHPRPATNSAITMEGAAEPRRGPP
jgi:hypothetical protein